jgi:hypothetical protein
MRKLLFVFLLFSCMPGKIPSVQEPGFCQQPEPTQEEICNCCLEIENE